MKKVLTMMVTALAMMAACGGSSGGTVEGFCTQAAAAQSTLGDTASDTARGIALLENLTKNAPSEIKSDMTTVLSYLKNSSSSASGSPDTVTQASLRVVQFIKEKCHIELGGSSSKFSSVGSAIEN